MTLDSLAASPARAALFLDFDGVLADITDDPADATPRPGVPELVDALSGRLGRVAVISGRPVAYIVQFVPESVDVVGLYGLEWRVGGEHRSLPGAEDWRATIAELSAAAERRFGADVVEAKGLSLTVHYRNNDELAGPIRQWAAEQAERTGVELRPAKRSFELHPPLRRDKGTAVLEMATGLDAVAYIGDDLGDLPAFDGLDELARRGATTVRVAVESPEVPPILVSRADLVVDGTAGAEALMRELLATLDAASAG